MNVSVTIIDIIVLLRSACLASLMTLGWTLMVNVPKRYIWLCLVLTLLGFSLREVMKQQHISLVLSTFLAAGISSFLAIYWAKRYLLTPKMILVPAMLCMMPGVTAHKAMISFVQLGYYGYDPQIFSQMMNFGFLPNFTIEQVIQMEIPQKNYGRN